MMRDLDIYGGLMGVVCGDVIGLPYEFRGYRTKDYHFPLQLTDYSDDTILTMAVAEWLTQGERSKARIKECLLKYASRFMHKNVWGRGFAEWVKSGGVIDRKGIRSNGAAMRVVPIGYASDDKDEVLRLADLSARVSHDSDESSRGAQAVALTVMMARQKQSKAMIKDTLTSLFGYHLERTIDEIRATYQFEIFCDLCVPESIICWLQSDTYEATVRNAVSLGGDADTMAAIAGGIATASGMEIPDSMAKVCYDLLPDDFHEIIHSFHQA